MKVLIYEQWQGGHYYNYLEYLIPKVAELVDEVIVTTTKTAFETERFQKKFKEIQKLDNVRFHSTLKDEDPTLPIKDRFKLLSNLYNNIKEVNPDYVMVPSADCQSFANGILGLLKLGSSPFNIPIEVTLHNGYGPSKLTSRQKLKEFIYKLTYSNSTWNHMNFVNAHYFDHAKLHNRKWIKTASLIPDPVSKPALMTKNQARMMLGIPECGKYIGFLGHLDPRNNIPLLLKSFENTKLPDNYRLILAGSCPEELSLFINNTYSNLIKSKRLIFINRFLTDDEVLNGYQALDSCCIPRTDFPGLSSLALKSIASNRPLLVHNFGWAAYMTKKFNLGHVCNMNSVNSFSKALTDSFNYSPDTSFSQSREKFLRFHSVNNFAEHMVHKMVLHFNISYEDKRLLWEDLQP